MSDTSPMANADRQLLQQAAARGPLASLSAFFKLSGPGFLQAAITLGGGSLTGALYLGVLGGFSLLWLQLFAVGMGVIMLSAISYVVLSTGEKPFQAINLHINPVLGWAWAIASLLASIVWCFPQFSLGTAVLQQNLLPSLLGAESLLGITGGKIVISLLLLALSVAVVWRYDSKGQGIKTFETILKAMVALIVLSFFGVVVKLALSEGGISWGGILGGFIPRIRQWSEPAQGYAPFIAQVPEAFQQFWSAKITSQQQNVMIAAAAAAVGINMTFLLPYSMLAKGWDVHFRSFARFDLVLGMVIPFVLVTSCVVIASASRFHTQPGEGLLEPGAAAPAGLVRQYNGLLNGRAKAEAGGAFATMTAEEKTRAREALPDADKRMAAMLVKRDAFNLAASLKPLLGATFANVIFGIGVLGMALSTIIIEMLIAGFVICEMFGWPARGKAHRWACMVSAVGVLGPFIWSGKTLFWLAVPTSVIGMMLLPIAYITFLFMMNSKSLLGDALPRGGSRWTWNVLMIIATASASIAAAWSIWSKAKWVGVGGIVVLLLLAVAAHRRTPGRKPAPDAT